MVEDVYEPLARYRDEFREKFARLTHDKFVELTEASGVDVEANRRTVREIHTLEQRLSGARTRRALWCTLMVLGYAGALVCGYLATQVQKNNVPPLVAGVVGSAAFAVWMTLLFRQTGREVESLETALEARKKLAWQQMDALNRSYTWDITPRLIEATVPRLSFDPFFTARRLADLRRLYEWSDAFNDGKSILFAQSGVINGNPFLLGEYLEMEWGEATYTGHLEISWQERERDSEGRLRTVTRHQTLTASVRKPVPEYATRKILIYGNDAAPALTFSRVPSGLDADGVWTSVRKWWRLRRLKAFSRNLKDASQFTLMANQEFETWFHAKDRDNEVEFRLLFTALAQTQMLSLMKDVKTGFGDDFVFQKRHKLNFLFSRHLADAPIDTAPERFRNWNYDAAAAFFQAFNEKYFRDIYFALAPLLAIPLYQQTRTHEDIWKGVVDSDASSFWEHEATANYFGEERFQHPDCITHNILKTEVISREDGVSRVQVTAHGYRGEDRLEYVRTYGGDGHYHEVPVKWIEYLAVERSSEMTVAEAEKPHEAFRRGYHNAAAAVFRRSVRSYLGGVK